MPFNDRDMLFWHRLDRFSFDGLANSKILNSTEGSPDGFGHQFLSDPPFEHTPNTSDVLVDSLSADALLDQLLTARRQCERSEVGDWVVSIKPPHWPQRRLKTANLAGLLPVLDVPLLGPFPKRKDRSLSLSGWVGVEGLTGLVEAGL
jgi:hypothetical protein